ncbi:RHTO0S02e10528g1_1 [Rhodotorula toruloides]|uniref:non-specific serine/threonine protein kinase n=1 Tax=Rhodotorula toruloides TaxID=5286 RepID=A0A061AQS9_RHOTO|nr:RHTO0S02e10528g1_1 [Rhodotorula toruloides]
MHRLDPILPPPPGFALVQALKSTIQPSDAFTSRAKAEEALCGPGIAKKADDKTSATGQQESDGTEGGNKGDAGGRAGGVAEGGVPRGVRHFSASSSFVMRPRAREEKEPALPARFNLVAAWWGNGRGRSQPITYELVTARHSLPASEPIPTVVMDQRLSKKGSLFIAKSTATDFVFKEVWVADERATELLNEGAIFDELYRQDDAADFLVGYAGFFESTNESHYLLVTEAGEALEDWRKESDAVIEIVEQLHQRGYVHGDLAERNVVRTPAGLRLIDLGRARRAEEHELAQEMEQLKKVLAGEAHWIDYSFLGYYIW